MQKTFEIPQKFTYKELSAALSELCKFQIFLSSLVIHLFHLSKQGNN